MPTNTTKDQSGPTPTDLDSRNGAENKLWAELHANPESTAAELAALAGIGRSTAGKILTRWADDDRVTRTTGTPTEGTRRAPDRWSITEPTPAPATTPDTAAPDDDPTPTVIDTADTPDAATTDLQPVDTDTAVSNAEPDPAAAAQTQNTDDAELEDDPEPAGDPEPTDPVGVIELGNGITLAYPTVILSTAPVTCENGSACGVVDLLRLLAALSATAKPLRKPQTTRSGGPRLAKGALRGMVEDFLTHRPGEEFGANAVATALGRSSGAVANALDQLERDNVVTLTTTKPRRYQITPAE